MDRSQNTDASGGGESKRPWQPWERSYSGNRVGVRQEGDWTILHILSGGAETTTSIREHEAWDLAGRVSPKLLTALQEAGAENRQMRDALHALSAVCAAGNAEQLREAAEEIYCGDDCKHHFYDGSCNSHECSLEGTGECGWHRSESLKSLAEALETHAALASAPPAPTPDAGSDLAKLSERANEVVQRVSEWDDRTSPEDWPEALLITGEELHRELVAFAKDTASPPPAEDLAGQGEPVVWIERGDLSLLTDAYGFLRASPSEYGGFTRPLYAEAASSEPNDREMATAEKIATVLLGRRGFAFYTDPMEGGQDAYDISCEALDEANAVLKLFAAPAPSRPADREALYQIYSQYIVNRGDMEDADALTAIRHLCERAGLGGRDA